MQLTINAENAADLQTKVSDLYHQLSGKDIGPRLMKVSVSMPNGTKHEAELPSKPQEPQVESVFGGGTPTEPTEKKVGEGVKAIIPESAKDAIADEKLLNEQKESAIKSGITRDMIGDELRAVIAKCGGNAAREMMAGAGYAHIGKVPDNKFEEFIALCQKTMKEKAKK